MGGQARVSRQAAPAPSPAVFPPVPPPGPGIIPSASKWRPQVSGRLEDSSLPVHVISYTLPWF